MKYYCVVFIILSIFIVSCSTSSGGSGNSEQCLRCNGEGDIMVNCLECSGNGQINCGNVTDLVINNALGAMVLVIITVTLAMEKDMKIASVVMDLEQKDVIHAMGMVMISTETNVPGVGEEDIRIAFRAMEMEEKNVSHVTVKVIRIVLGAMAEDIMIVVCAMARGSLIAKIAMDTVI